MRLFLVSLVFAFLAMLPQVAILHDWEVPEWLRMVSMLPHFGLEYMVVFFHELGHSITALSYGQFAMPIFDFANGGGFSVPLTPRFLVLQGVVYIGALFVGYLLFSDGMWLWLGSLVTLLVVHACFSTGEHYMLPVNYMGNGGAVVMGCFCIWRAALNKVVSETSRELERYVHMAFGLYAVLNDGIMLAWNLMTSDIVRESYAEGKGESHIANDFTVIADRLDTNIQHVAAFHMLFTLAAIAVTCVLIFVGWRAQQDELAEAPAPLRRSRGL